MQTDKSKIIFLAAFLLCLSVGLLWVMRNPHHSQSGAIEEKLNHPIFGTVHIYGQSTKPKHIVIYVAGQEGWTSALAAKARAITTLDTLVAGVETAPFLQNLAADHNDCSEVAKSFRKLAKFVEEHYRYENYVFPILAGEGSGSTLVYTALAQGTPNVFAGAISFGFCPDLNLAKPFCKINKLDYEFSKNKDVTSYHFKAAKELPEMWDIFPGRSDTPTCSLGQIKSYIKNTAKAKMMLPERQEEWLTSFHQVFDEMIAAQMQATKIGLPETLKDLPINITEAAYSADKSMAILISGDGGWARIDRGIADALGKQGVPVVGFDSLRYFWNPKTPEQTAYDIGRVIDYYSATWKPSSIILVGYSRGADVLPFIVTRLSEAQRSHIRSVALLAPGKKTKFKFHFMDWLPVKNLAVGLSVLSEIQKMPEAKKVLCFYSKDDSVTESVCPDLDVTRHHIIETEGDHHFNENYKGIAGKILSF